MLNLCLLNLTFKRFGCAKILISDQGREFVNSINDELQNLLGTKHRMTSVYHPQTNGWWTVQSCLLKVVNEHQNEWDDYLDPVLFAIWISKHKSTGHTPFEMMYKGKYVWVCNCVHGVL